MNHTAADLKSPLARESAPVTIVATGSLFARAEFDAVHINSQLPEAQQISTDHDAALTLFTVPVRLTGTIGADTINGTAAAEIINALAGNDRVFAGAGNDTFGGDTVAGVHAVSGGLGQDTFLVTSAGEAVTIDLTTGLVTGGYASGSTLVSVEAVNARKGNFVVEMIGTAAAETFTGGRQADKLSGGGGNDRLTGGRGADILSGGAGNDSFIFARGEVDGDIILDFQGAGMAGGDVLVLSGFGPGATLSNVGEIWTVTYGAGLTESFEIAGVTSLGAGDVIFG
jgi:Ca2+-binding RTX toxin-like protein